MNTLGLLTNRNNGIKHEIERLYKQKLANVVVEWLTPLLRILEVPGSNIGPGTAYPL
jgi:hypothetical protein